MATSPDGRCVLLAWELGGGGGHIVALQRIGVALAKRGIVADLATLRLRRVSRMLGGYRRLFQSPVLPALSGLLPRTAETPGRDLIDILASLGFDDAATIERQIVAWRGLIETARPALVVADYSPGAVLAARGRVPVLAVGTPFCTPYATDGHFAAFGEEPGDAGRERSVLAAINAALIALDGAPAADIPDAIVPTDCLPAGFAELDPYADARRHPLLPPIIEQCASAPGKGADIAVFLPASLKNDAVVVATLLGIGRPVHMDATDLEPEPRHFYETRGVRITPHPIEADEVARSARVLLSHGGFHTVCRGFVAGVPQVVIAADRDKQFQGKAVERLGVGRMVARRHLSLPALREAITEVAEDPRFGERARALAPGFRERHAGGDSIDMIADRVAAMIR